MKDGWVELIAEEKTLAEVKILRDIFLGDSISTLQFEISMMPHNYTLKKCNGGYKFINTQEKFSYLMYMQKKKWNGTGGFDRRNKYIPPKYRNEIPTENVPYW